MRDRFPWYFLETKDFDAAWDEGVLTTDANVLLDLYRYNKETREALLTALESFKGKFWISHQTSKEFVKNRRTVISDMANDFAKAQKPIADLEKEIQAATKAIRACRVIPKELCENLEKEALEACRKVSGGIDKERADAPDFEQKDEVIERLEDALEGSIGSQPDDIANDLKEAQRRKDNKVPPGYMDDDKDGWGFAGDYLMWKQILSHCSEIKSPMILVTSETKEDWWERKSGKTLNPRLELLQEAFEKTGQKILIYHTDHFLKLHQDRLGKPANESVLEEIREYSLAREPAVNVVQETAYANNISNTGLLKISISRPVRNFTGSGRFSPEMSTSPQVTAKLVACPESSPDIAIRANTGTTFDFNVHVHSGERGRELPVGEYLVEYGASCNTTNKE